MKTLGCEAKNTQSSLFRRRGNPNVTYLDAMSYHFDGGYITFYPMLVPAPFFPSVMITNYVPSYHYYIRDYQGNNRVVVAHNGTVEQQNDYYAYGGPWGNTSTNQGFQPFKYNGKELDRVHGLDWYDYGARRYDPAFAQFTQMDPLCEKYPHLSPYTYCAGNPVRYVDPDGMRINISALSEEEKKRYKEQIELLSSNSSFFDHVYKTLENSSDIYNVTYAVFQSSMGTEGKGRFIANDKGGGNIEFGKNLINEIGLAIYLEEIFHAFQHENRLGYDKGEFNREFEAKTFVTIAGNEANFGYPVLESMADFQTALQDYSYKGFYGVPSPLVATSFSFFNQYLKYANIFSHYNSDHGIGNKNYRNRTTVLPYSLLKVIGSNF